MAREIGETLEDICGVLKEIRRALRQDALGKDFYTVHEAAEYRKVSDYTIRRWIKEGKLKADKADGTKNARHRITRASLEALGTAS